MVQPREPLRAEPSGAADARRLEILAAASEVFRRKGFAATGMREIAAALGMTAGNLYYYFESKEELLAFCQETTLDTLLAEIEAIRALELPAAEALRRSIRAHVECLNRVYPGSLAHLEIEALTPARRTPIAAKRRRYETALGELLRRGVERGELAVADVRLATLALLGSLNWTVKWFDAGGPRSAAEVGEEFARLFLAGLERRA